MAPPLCTLACFCTDDTDAVFCGRHELAIPLPKKKRENKKLMKSIRLGLLLLLTATCFLACEEELPEGDVVKALQATEEGAGPGGPKTECICDYGILQINATKYYKGVKGFHINIVIFECKRVYRLNRYHPQAFLQFNPHF